MGREEGGGGGGKGRGERERGGWIFPREFIFIRKCLQQRLTEDYNKISPTSEFVEGKN